MATVVDFKNGISATGVLNNDTATFTLLGGKYGVGVSSSGTASVTLQILMPDAATFVAVGAAVTTYATFDLPAGTYKAVAGALMTTGAFAILPIPYRAFSG